MATLTTKVHTLLAALKKPRLLCQKKEFVFIVSHMRARTTLLSHILDNSADIVGSNELHVRYRNVYDEFKVKAMRVHDSGFADATYVCDKLLHNRLIVNLNRYQNAKFIFNLRPTDDTFKSLIVRHLEHQTSDTAPTIQRYYRERLQFMQQVWSKINPDNRIYINSDDVINDTEMVLSKLNTFLNLKTGLSAEYRVSATTGLSGHGDMSENITQGKIVKTTPKQLSSEQSVLFEQLCTSRERELFVDLERIFLS